jgi:glycosyltransferase involved in cell wall biosynthesis
VHSGEVLWSPANSSAWGIGRQAVTLHDASVFDHPEWFKPSFAAWTRLSWRILAKRAQAIVTVSGFSRQRLNDNLRISDEKIHIIPNGVGTPFEPQTNDSVERVKAKYNLRKPYFLFVGTHEPRKNLQTLIKAWEIFHGAKTNFSLALAGTEGTVFSRVDRIGNTANRLGYVPDADLPSLYAGAIAVIIPSYYEGFGLSALEAAACGTPAIASNTGAFPETMGDAALLISPGEPGEISEAMMKIVEDRTLASSLRERGLERAAKFSWDESANKTQSLLENFQ